MAIGLGSSWAESDHPYATKVAVLATKHDKLDLIAPPLGRIVGLQVEVADVDTDVLGTFSGETPRKLPPLDTAIAKARLGMSTTGHRLGLASEGSIGPDPAMPLAVSDMEIVVLVDDDDGIVIWESHRSWEIVADARSVSPGEDFGAFLSRVGFPEHRLIVRPNSGSVHPIHKGISSPRQLDAIVAECAAASRDGLARVETDLRAHVCPSRRPTIAEASERLARRVAARCPSCGAPGWGGVDVIIGVPCGWCGTEVSRVAAEVDGCTRCEYRQTRPVVAENARADPGECPYCNP